MFTAKAGTQYPITGQGPFGLKSGMTHLIGVAGLVVRGGIRSEAEKSAGARTLVTTNTTYP